jgi:hypothetical protein
VGNAEATVGAANDALRDLTKVLLSNGMSLIISNRSECVVTENLARDG